MTKPRHEREIAVLNTRLELESAIEVRRTNTEEATVKICHLLRDTEQALPPPPPEKNEPGATPAPKQGMLSLLPHKQLHMRTTMAKCPPSWFCRASTPHFLP